MDGDGDDDDDFCIRENEDVVAPIPKRETNSFVNVSIIVKKWQKCVSLMALSGLHKASDRSKYVTTCTGTNYRTGTYSYVSTYECTVRMNG